VTDSEPESPEHQDREPEAISSADDSKESTRREFIARLAKTAALPVVLPLMLTMSTAALAY
jgi:hypothetical protein